MQDNYAIEQLEAMMLLMRAAVDAQASTLEQLKRTSLVLADCSEMLDAIKVAILGDTRKKTMFSNIKQTLLNHTGDDE